MFEYLSYIFKAVKDWVQPQETASVSVGISTQPAPPKTRSSVWYCDSRIDDYIDKMLPNAFYSKSIVINRNGTLLAKGFKEFINNPNEMALKRNEKKYKEKNCVIFPYNSGNHWQLYVLDRFNNTVYHMDALNYKINDKVANDIIKFAKLVWPDLENSEFKIQKIEMPNQGNTVDCGPAICQMMHHIATKGLQDLIMWAELQKQKDKYFDYGAFRDEVDKLLGEHIPYVASVIKPVILSNDNVNKAEKRKSEVITIESDSDDPDHKKIKYNNN